MLRENGTDAAEVETALLGDTDYENIALDDRITSKDDRHDEHILYDSDHPHAEYPLWRPAQSSVSKTRRCTTNTLSVAVLSLILVAIIELLMTSARTKAFENSPFILSAQRGPLGATIQQTWVLHETHASRSNRTIIIINGQEIGPTIEAWLNQTITITIRNEMTRSTAIHWHGVSQFSSNDKDGVPNVTQDPISPGQTFVYSFTADTVGTFWWHAHSGTARLDGLYGALIVHPLRVEDESRVSQATNETLTDLIILAGDWYESNTEDLVSTYLNPDNSALIEPLPTAIIVNGLVEAGNLSSIYALPKVRPSTRYWRLRFINIGAMAELKITAPVKADGWTVIEADASPTMPVKVDSLALSPGQRYSVVLDTDDYSVGEEIVIALALELTSHHHTAHPSAGSYGHAHTHSHAHHHRSDEAIKSRHQLTDGMLHPPMSSRNASGLIFRDSPSLTTLTLGMRDVNGVTRSTINGRTYTPANHTLANDYAHMSSKGPSELSTKYSSDILTLSLAHGESMLVLFVNKAGGNHPMHVHGHTMLVLATNSFFFDPVTQSSTARPFDESSISSILRAASRGTALERPIARDTINVADNGWVLVLITGHGKGLWSMHCHSAWHEISGMAMLVEVR